MLYKRSKRICIVLSFIFCTQILMAAATTYTYARNEKNDLVRTQDAYLPDKTILNLGLFNPEDMFIDDSQLMFIADTGNRRIVLFDIISSRFVGEITNPLFKRPSGVFVTTNGSLYIADSRAEAIFVYQKKDRTEYSFEKEILRPGNVAFGDTPYNPNKIAADNLGNIFLVGEGVYNGIIQLSSNGDFLGYYTMNKTMLSLSQAFRFMFYTKEQKNASLARIPVTFSNLFLDRSGTLYTTTMGTVLDGIKKHNTSGVNMFIKKSFNTNALTDITVDENGIMYLSDKNGLISVYTNAGEDIFYFGGIIDEADIAGQFSELSAIAVDKNHFIWTLDKEKGFIQSFKPTDYTLSIYEAIDLNQTGRYEEALLTWNKVLLHNQMSVLAHRGIGMSYLYLQDFHNARDHFRVAGDRENYSQAWWEIRNIWIQNFLIYFVVFILLFGFGKFVFDKLDSHSRVATRMRGFSNVVFALPFLKHLHIAKDVSFHPINTYYDIRKKKKGSLKGASFLILIFFIAFLVYQTSKGFLFQIQKAEDIDLAALITGFIVLVGLYIVCNYLLSSITEGDGSFEEIVMYVGYSLLPLLAALLVNIVLSYVLTYNEGFFYSFILNVGAIWSLLLFLLGVQEIHQFRTRTSIANILLTLFFMIVIIVMVLIVIVMWYEVWQFITGLGKEFIENVFKK